MKPQAHALPPDVQHAAFERDLAINEVVRVNKAHEALLAECKRQREEIAAHAADRAELLFLRNEVKRQREEMRDVAFLLLAQERRGEALKWARGLTGNVGAPEQTAVRIEEVIDLSAERDSHRDQINALRETLKFARRIIGANECGTDDVLGLIDAALKVTP